jgi:hypothetical protein
MKRSKLSADTVVSDDSDYESSPKVLATGKDIDGSPECLVQRNAEGEAYLELSKTRRVTVRQWRASTLVDIREFYADGEGVWKPGKKGISLTREQFMRLRELMPVIEGLVEGKGEPTGAGS